MYLAQIDDIEDIVNLGREFWVQTEYHTAGMEYDSDKCAQLCFLCVEDGIALIERDESGFLCGFLLLAKTEPLMSRDRMFSDIAFYVRPDCRNSGLGYDLMVEGERLASERGGKLMTMMNLHSVDPDKAERLFRHCGFSPSETTFTKII